MVCRIVRGIYMAFGGDKGKGVGGEVSIQGNGTKRQAKLSVVNIEKRA